LFIEPPFQIGWKPAIDRSWRIGSIANIPCQGFFGFLRSYLKELLIALDARRSEPFRASQSSHIYPIGTQVEVARGSLPSRSVPQIMATFLQRVARLGNFYIMR